ncbi:BrnT family toxin [uncultured Parasphingorhabdus sp.]|uniref:BrnT family toxin n=1 Tax=uncultured Parasphingorhabdus sp. TaxID=2709694 RepID=UPI0030DABC67
MKITFDPAKRQWTLEARGLDFADAALIFQARHISQLDDRQEYGEKRFITYGYIGSRIVAMVWTERGTSRRIISLRKANEREQRKVREALDRPG